MKKSLWQVPGGFAIDLNDVADRRAQQGRPYLEFLDTPSMSAGLYALAAGGEDRQQPHERDEIYHVIEGRALLRVGEEATPVAPGSVVYVRAGLTHRFEEIESDLKILVIFANEPTGETTPKGSDTDSR